MLKLASVVAFIAGALLNLTDIVLPLNVILALLTIYNMAIGYVLSNKVNYMYNRHDYRYGCDYVAYLQQANALYEGETDYTRISSNQGPCFYPAGHLYHYLVVLMVHLRLENATFIMRLVHYAIQNLIQVFMIKLTYRYNKAKWSHKGQLMAFYFMAFLGEREFVMGLYNDQIMTLWLVIAIYQFSKMRPIVGTLCFSMAYGVKAGAILMIPGILGSVQYNHGTLKTITCLIIIVGMQVLFAAPFIFSGETTVKDYMQRSKLGGQGSAGILGRPESDNWLAAKYLNTIFWTFIDQDLYEQKWFADGLKACMLLANVWFFFITKRCFNQCFYNLMHWRDDDPKKQSVRLTVEVLVIQYMAGVLLMPGAHVQFQFWFLCFVPLLLQMTGIPPLLVVWIPIYFFPISDFNQDTQLLHQFLLGLIGSLLLIGPQHSIQAFKMKQD